MSWICFGCGFRKTPPHARQATRATEHPSPTTTPSQEANTGHTTRTGRNEEIWVRHSAIRQGLVNSQQQRQKASNHPLSFLTIKPASLLPLTAGASAQPPPTGHPQSTTTAGQQKQHHESKASGKAPSCLPKRLNLLRAAHTHGFLVPLLC